MRQRSAELLGKCCQNAGDLLGLWIARDPLYSLRCRGSLATGFAQFFHDAECCASEDSDVWEVCLLRWFEIVDMGRR